MASSKVKLGYILCYNELGSGTTNSTSRAMTMTTIRTLIESGRAIRGVIVRTPCGNYACVQGIGPIGETVEVDGGGYFKPEELQVVDDVVAGTYRDAVRLSQEKGLEEVRFAFLKGEYEALNDLSGIEAREMVQHLIEYGCKGVANMDVYELATGIAKRYCGEDVGVIFKGIE